MQKVKFSNLYYTLDSRVLYSDSAFYKYNQLINLNNKNQNIIKNLNKELIDYKNDYNDEITKNKELNDKLNMLSNELNKMENIKQIYNEAQNDLSCAKNAINEINIKNVKNQHIINTLYTDKAFILSSISMLKTSLLYSRLLIFSSLFNNIGSTDFTDD